MNKAEAKEYLYQVSKQKRLIERKQERVEELLEHAASPGSILYDDIKVQTSIDPGKNAELIAEEVDLQNEIVADIIILMEMIHERCNVIGMVDCLLHLEILFEKYIKGETLEVIRQKIRKPGGEMYRYDHLSREHGNALAAVAEIMTKEKHNDQTT